MLHMSRRGSRLPESETTVVEEFSVQQCDSDTNVDGYENEIDDFENYSKIFGSSKKAVSVSVKKLAVSEDRTEEVSAVDPKPGAKFTLLQNKKKRVTRQSEKQKENFFEKRSKSIMNLFKTTEGIRKPRRRNPDVDKFNSQSTLDFNEENNFGNKSFILKEKKSMISDNSLKMANVWNCDWNVNIITEMHINF